MRFSVVAGLVAELGLFCNFAILSAQAPARPAYENTGRPIRLSSQCTLETVHSLNLDCSEQEPCPVYLELVAVETVGNRLLTTGNLHTSSATVESILLVSDDLGKSWTEPYPRIPGAGLDQIQFFDFGTGWISGQLLQTLPRDAFFLITGDGGKTWRKRPVSGEPRVGTIEQFWFDSPSRGTMLMDRIQAGESGMRHELYESMTGGDSWSLRQVDNKPIPVKTPQRSAEWRVRADAASKSYRVERRANDRWTSVASFLVAAGECKPAEPVVEEPPPPPEPEPERESAPSAKPSRPPSLRKSNP